MVSLQVLSGPQRGTHVTISRFPFSIGRSTDNTWAVQETGVWEKHCRLDLQPTHEIGMTTLSNALTLVNDVPQQLIPLRNGDVITLGSLQLRFLLAPTTLRPLTWRERLTWIGLGALALGQIVLIYQLLD